MIAPPRTAEILLESLGADAGFRDPLLGDLAEKFALRVERDGPVAAHRWYYREALRAVPYLLRAWGHSLHPRDVRRLLSVVVASYVFTMMLAVFAMMMANGVAAALGVSLASALGSAGHPALALTVVGGIVSTVAGGYIAAWLDDRAPLASAAALGVVWSVITLVESVLAVGGAEPMWFRFAAPAWILIGPVLGGGLRVHRLSASPSSAAVSRSIEG